MKLACVFTFVAGCASALTDSQVDEMYVRAAASYVQKALHNQGERAGSKKDSLVVPTAAVAEAIHAAVEGAVYGPKLIEEERPFRSVRSGDFWVVFGTLPQTVVGSTAVTVIRASTGEVLLMTHE